MPLLSLTTPHSLLTTSISRVSTHSYLLLRAGTAVSSSFLTTSGLSRPSRRSCGCVRMGRSRSSRAMCRRIRYVLWFFFRGYGETDRLCRVLLSATSRPNPSLCIRSSKWVSVYTICAPTSLSNVNMYYRKLSSSPLACYTIKNLWWYRYRETV